MVLKGLSKVNRDYSIMMATAWKEKVSQKEEDEEEVDIEDIDETDHPWISRKVYMSLSSIEKLIMR